MKKRKVYYKLIKFIEHKNALIVTGMRQVGKTTLLKQIFDNLKISEKIWFDLDNPLDQLIFEETDYNNIFRNFQNLTKTNKNRIYVFIDEIQNFPEITRIIKYLIDHYGVKFIVTGSSNFYLKNLFPESLSGRKFLFHLAPLNFQEYLYFKEKKTKEELLDFNYDSIIKPQSLYKFKLYEQDYNDYLNFGGFPEVVLTNDIDTKKMILGNILTSFFEKDIRLLSDYKDIRELRDFIRLLVPRVGSMLDITKLSVELGITRVKSYSYLEFLQGTYFIRLLSKFSQSIDKSIAGGKKFYFADTGLLKLIGNVNDGQLFENAVVNQLSQFGDLSFYNKRNTAEIDIILNNEKAFEVKLNATIYDYERLKKLSEKIGIEKFYLVSLNYKEIKNVIYPMFI